MLVIYCVFSIILTSEWEVNKFSLTHSFDTLELWRYFLALLLLHHTRLEEIVV
jgi:hypothetical protein